MNESKVVIITLNYNQNEYTLSCINSILESTYDNFQIILIDNGSLKDNFLKLKNKLSKDERIILKRIENNRGYVGGINFGLKEAETLAPDYLLIMNNDTIIDANAMSELLQACQNENDNVIATGKTYDYGKNTIQYIGDKLIDHKSLKFHRVGSGEVDKGQYNELSYRDMIDDIYWMVPNKIYINIGLYSTLFYFNGESADYALRAKNKGYKLLYVPDSKLWHKGSVSIGGKVDNPIKSYWISQSRTLLRLLHLKGVNKLSFALRELINLIAIFFKNIVFFKRIKLQLSYSKLLGYLSAYLILIKGSNSGRNPFKTL